MKINPTGAPNYISGNYRAGKADVYKKSQTMPPSDQASLSDEAISFSKAFARVRQDSAAGRSDQELERIAQITRQVKDGSYNVKADDVAESILANLLG